MTSQYKIIQLQEFPNSTNFHFTVRPISERGKYFSCELLYFLEHFIFDMGNQNCYQTKQSSMHITIPIDGHQQPSGLTQWEQNILDTEEEMDEGSPASKFDIKFIATTVRASTNKESTHLFAIPEDALTVKPNVPIKVPQINNQVKNNLLQWTNKINLAAREKRYSCPKFRESKIVAIQSFASFICKEQIPFFAMKISGESFYKIRQEAIYPYYQMLKKIGEGSFGSVYKGKCMKTGDLRAIKVLKKKIMNEKDQKSLLSQINILKKMDHINIIKLYDVFYFKSFFYVVTQFCEGGSLLQALQKQQIKSEKDVIVLMRQIFSAVSYMHQMKVAHRDLKLDNIVLVKQINRDSNSRACVKIIDFGLAQQIQNPHKNTKTGIVGTISYMAPQIFSGYYSTKSDVWSCGIIICMLLIGFNPFKRKKQPLTIYAIQTQQINFLQREWHKVSTKVKSLVSQMLEKNTDKRITMEKGLNHDWFKILSSGKEKNGTQLEGQVVINNFNNYHRGNNFICYVKNFLISRQITQSMRQEIALIFQKIDADSSGVIEKQQLIQLYSLVSGITNVEEVQKLIEKIDQNHSGRIDFHEFLVCMTNNQMIRNQACIEEAFNFFDEDRTGYIEKSQLFDCLEGCEEQQVVAILRDADFNGDGKISREEFFKYLMNVKI